MSTGIVYVSLSICLLVILKTLAVIRTTHRSPPLIHSVLVLDTRWGKNVLSAACLFLKMIAAIVPGLNTVSFLGEVGRLQLVSEVGVSQWQLTPVLGAVRGSLNIS